MFTTELITEKDDIDCIVPECVQLAKAVNATLPFQYMHMPIMWWESFRTQSGVQFWSKRGKNFLGLQSRLEKFQLQISRNNNVLCGVVPLVQYSVKLSSGKEELRIITFAGDYMLHPYQDILVKNIQRQQIVQCIFEHIAELINKDDLVCRVGYLPESSPNITAVRQSCATLHSSDIGCTEAISSQKGGIWPWTKDEILETPKKINTQCEESRINVVGLSDVFSRLVHTPAHGNRLSFIRPLLFLGHPYAPRPHCWYHFDFLNHFE